MERRRAIRQPKFRTTCPGRVQRPDASTRPGERRKVEGRPASGAPPGESQRGNSRREACPSRQFPSRAGRRLRITPTPTPAVISACRTDRHEHVRTICSGPARRAAPRAHDLGSQRCRETASRRNRRKRSLVVLVGPHGSVNRRFARMHGRPTEIVPLLPCRDSIGDDETDQTAGAFELRRGVLRREHATFGFRGPINSDARPDGVLCPRPGTIRRSPLKAVDVLLRSVRLARLGSDGGAGRTAPPFHSGPRCE